MKAIYAFSGDPITWGHIDIIDRAAATYGHVTVGIGANPQKVREYLFSVEERLDMAKRSVAHLENVDCVVFQGLLAQFAYRNGYNVIIRGVRNGLDLEAELTLYNVNQLQFSTIDTVFFPARPRLSHVSSSVVKAIVSEGGDVSEYVPIHVKQKLEQKIIRQLRIGVTGGVASGKSFVSKRLVEKIPCSRRIDLNEIGHYILGNSSESAYQETRARIGERFGEHLLNDDGSVDRSLLGAIVFQSPRKLGKLNEIMLKPILARLYETCMDNNHLDQGNEVKKLFLEAGLFVESRLTHLVNHCVIHVISPEEVKVRRLVKNTGISEDEAVQKIRREISDDERRAYLGKMLERNQTSFLIELDNRDEPVPDSFIRKVRSHIDELGL